jgi:glycosyltransferase involved in cell wall biosynthesis
MKLAMLLNFSPRKLGSFEDWLLALAEGAQKRGHRLDFFGRVPVHPDFAAALAGFGTRWQLADTLERAPRAAVRKLSRYEVLYLNMVSVRHPLALLCYAAWPARVLIADHTSGVALPGGPVKQLARRMLDRLTMARVGAIAGVSEYVRMRDQRHFHLPRRRVRTIYNGVDLARFSPSDRLGNPPVILAVANLIRHKGLHHLVEAFARIDRPARLRIAGDGPEAPALEEQARALGVAGSVEFLGLRDDIDRLLRECDVFVHPAVWAEAFGLTIAEAMATGRPVVASAIGGIPELIDHGVTGLLVTPGNPAALARALDRLIADAELREGLGRNARRRVEERFDLHQSVNEHLRFCERFARSRPIGVPSTLPPEL